MEGCGARSVRALLPAPAQLLDAAWLGAGGRQVTSPKVNADGCAGKHRAAASTQPGVDPLSPDTAHPAVQAAAGGR